MTSQPKKRWQFRLRDLVWLTLVAALGLGWYLDRRTVRKREIQALDREAIARENEAEARQAAHDDRMIRNQVTSDFDQLNERYYSLREELKRLRELHEDAP